MLLVAEAAVAAAAEPLGAGSARLDFHRADHRAAAVELRRVTQCRGVDRTVGVEDRAGSSEAACVLHVVIRFH